MMDGSTLTVERAVAKIGDGELSVRQLLASYFKSIERLENRVGAWAYFDRKAVLNQAGTIEEIVASGTATELPLLAIPVGVKDIFDTADIPTENGTSAQRGRQPREDAAEHD
jgi:Asp-tRNA(Asn)/Glu-tRNA(Gln) amidotransferase A subunit family amidase